MGKVLGSGRGITVSAQDIYEISATQRYRLGTRLVRGESVYRYVKAGAAITNNQYAVHPQSFREVRGATIPSGGDRGVGATDVLITVNAADGFASVGAAGDGEILVHTLEGGHIILVPQGWGVTNLLTYQILDNTGVAAGGGTMTVTLDGELPTAMVAGTAYCEEIVGNMYRDVVHNSNGDLCPHVGVPMRLLTAASPYGWIKTWGPMRMNAQTQVGAHTPSNPSTGLVFRHDGSVDLSVYNEVTNRYGQHAGYVMTNAGLSNDHSQSAPFIYLQVSP